MEAQTAVSLVSLIVGPALGYFSGRLIEKLKVRTAKEQAETQNAFSVGVTSHMAQVAFDKHVGFCEEYLKTVSRVLRDSAQQRDESALLAAGELVGVRQRWAIWLTDDLDEEFSRLEVALANSAAWTFASTGARESVAVHVKSLIDKLRKLLGTKELAGLRYQLTARSLAQGS